MGPNVKKLVCAKMARDLVPAGGGFQDAIAALCNPSRLGNAARDATEWVEHAIDLVIAAPNSPYGTDREAIAGEILKQIEEQKRP